MIRKSWMIVIAGIASVVTYGSSALADGSSLSYARGGMSFAAIDNVIAQYNQSRELFRIEGECRSSCTELLAIKTVCVEPNATLLFHAAIIHPDHPVDPVKNQRMASYYNSKLRSFVLANRYLDSWEFHPISGRDIIRKFGYRQCPRR